MIGGMVSSTLLTLIVIPAIYAVVKGLAVPQHRGDGAAITTLRNELETDTQDRVRPAMTGDGTRADQPGVLVPRLGVPARYANGGNVHSTTMPECLAWLSGSI